VSTFDAAKRVVDVFVSALLLTLSAPVQLVVALAVRWRLGSPVLFRQSRPGVGGKVFTLVKFRSMRDVDPAAGLTSDADRLTQLGRILRSTSLDELPTLWNVLRGDMSLVGPRPLLPEYLPLYDDRQARRHEVRPGITGLAQVNGRNAIDWAERLELDVKYVENRSVRLDVYILMRTLVTVIRRSGISDGASATMTPFAGTPNGQERR